MQRWMFLGVMLMVVFVLLSGMGMAAGPPQTSLLERFAALDAKVAALEAQVRALEQQLLAQANSPVMALNAYLTVDPAQHRIRFTGVNLQLVNGTGRTDTVNGRGNLLLGYDLARDDGTYFCADGQFTEKEPCEQAGQTWATSHKTGSHYLVIGDRNNYAQYGGWWWGPTTPAPDPPPA